MKHLTMICVVLLALRVAASSNADGHLSHKYKSDAGVEWQAPHQLPHNQQQMPNNSRANIIVSVFILATVTISVLAIRLTWLTRQSAMWRSAYIEELASSCSETAAAQMVKAAIHDEAYVVDKYDRRLLHLIDLASQSSSTLQHQVYLQTSCMSKLFRLKALHLKSASLHSRLLESDLVRVHHIMMLLSADQTKRSASCVGGCRMAES